MIGKVAIRSSGPQDVDKELWKKQMADEGFRYFVLKANEFLDSLSDDQVDAFNAMLKQYNESRAKKGKPINAYWVVNRDEPYADQVQSLIFEHP